MTDENQFFAESMTEIHEQYLQALEKHPAFELPGKPAAQIVMEELGELCQAMNDGDIQNALVECDHTIVTLLRWRRKIKMMLT